MKLDTILKQLSFGELSQLSIGEMVDGEWPEENRDKLVLHINAALTAIHKRFFLKEKREVVPLVADTFEYSLTATDLIQVEQLLDADGEEVPLNVAGSALAVAMPTYRTLRLPPRVEANADKHPLDTTASLTAVYRATTQITPKDLYYPPSMVEVDLPEVYLEPLLFYVASRLQAPVGMDGQQIVSNNYTQKYEMACRQLEDQGFTVSTTEQETGFERNGWV